MMKKLLLLITILFVTFISFSQIMNSDNPCRTADGKIWDIQRQIAFFQDHMKIDGNYYKQNDSGWEKCDDTPPTEYNYKNSDLDTNWCRTNIVSALSWFRVSGWVSYMDNIEGQHVLFITVWDSIKNRRVPLYCLYDHPLFSQFHINDRIDVMVYYRSEIHSSKTIRNNIEYESIEFGIPDAKSESNLIPLPKDTVEVVPLSSPTFVALPIPDNNELTFNTALLYSDFSFSFSFVVNDYNNAWPTLIIADGGGMSVGITGITSGGTGIGQLCFGSDNGIPRGHNWIIHTPSPISTNIKYNVVVTKNSSGVFMYINKNLVASSPIYNPIFPIGNKLMIGHGNNSILTPADSQFHGKISSVKFYPKCLTKPEVGNM